MTDTRILIVIGDPHLEQDDHRRVVRPRFTAIIRHAIDTWAITKVFHPEEAGPNRWLNEFCSASLDTSKHREMMFPKGRFEFGHVRNTRMLCTLRSEMELGARCIALYFKGPFLGSSSADDLARKCLDAGIKVIEFCWHPDNELTVINHEDAPQERRETA